MDPNGVKKIERGGRVPSQRHIPRPSQALVLCRFRDKGREREEKKGTSPFEKTYTGPLGVASGVGIVRLVPWPVHQTSSYPVRYPTQRALPSWLPSWLTSNILRTLSNPVITNLQRYQSVQPASPPQHRISSFGPTSAILAILEV